MTANPQPYRAPDAPPLQEVCAEHQYEGRFEITTCDDDLEAVAITVWCRACLAPLTWLSTGIADDPTVATLYCRPLETDS